MKKLALLTTLALTTSLSAFANENRDKAMQIIRDHQKSVDQVSGQSLVDYLNQDWIRMKVQEAKLPVVFLAIGNPGQTFWSQAQTNEVESMVEDLRRKNYLIVYDADSPILRQVVKKKVPVARYRLGITGRVIENRKEKRTVSIANSYMRMETISKFDRIMVFPDSTLGMGLMLHGLNGTEGNSKNLMPIGFKDNMNGLFEWARKLQREESTFIPRDRKRDKVMNMLPGQVAEKVFDSAPEVLGLTPEMPSMVPLKQYGIEFSRIVEQDCASTWVQDLPDAEAGAYFQSHDLDQYLETDLSQESGAETLKAGLGFNQEYNRGLKHVVTPHKVFGVLKDNGAVFFGSGEGGERYSSIIQSIGNVLVKKKVPFVTGGDRGYMRDLHKIAHDGGLFSVGIRKGQEKGTQDYHSKTFYAGDYNTRIPYLLLDRKLAIVAPGGKGTMRELATLMVHSAVSKDSPTVTFLDRDFWGGLHNWMTQTAHLDNMNGKLNLVHTEQEFKKSVNFSTVRSAVSVVRGH